jgi:hypothetical protein
MRRYPVMPTRKEPGIVPVCFRMSLLFSVHPVRRERFPVWKVCRVIAPVSGHPCLLAFFSVYYYVPGPVSSSVRAPSNPGISGAVPPSWFPQGNPVPSRGHISLLYPAQLLCFFHYGWQFLHSLETSHSDSHQMDAQVGFIPANISLSLPNPARLPDYGVHCS